MNNPDNKEKSVIFQKEVRLFLILGGFFLTNALIAEFIGVKIFSLEAVFGISPFQIGLLGQQGLSLNLSAGVLLWPFVFVLTDVINEYYGKRGVRFLSLLTAALISYAFAMFYLGIIAPPAGFWVSSNPVIPDMDNAFSAIFGQGLWIIAGSLVAFLIGQIVDVTVFHWFKKLTGERFIWLRATGSTVVSQFIDSFVVLFIAFYIGAGWSFQLVIAIGIVNYLYKFAVAVLMTPAIYLLHAVIDRHLGEELATKMKNRAVEESQGIF